MAADASEAGFPRRANAAKAAAWRILDAHEPRPHRVRCCLERRDAEFECIVGIDEKPGVQALGVTASDLPPVPGKHSRVGRDHVHVRHGTLSILAALDLHTGRIIANVESRHRSVEFVALLRRSAQAGAPLVIVPGLPFGSGGHTNLLRLAGA